MCSGYLGEFILGVTFWDYSALPLHIGRYVDVLICLVWGGLCVVWVRWVAPRFGRLVACYHFLETITGEGVIFDYKLRSGPSHTRNAIRLLNMLGFSQATVHRAQELAEKGENTP